MHRLPTVVQNSQDENCYWDPHFHIASGGFRHEGTHGRVAYHVTSEQWIILLLTFHLQLDCLEPSLGRSRQNV